MDDGSTTVYLLGTLETNFKGLRTLMALRVRRSTPPPSSSSSRPVPPGPPPPGARAAAAAAASAAAAALEAPELSVNMVM